MGVKNIEFEANQGNIESLVKLGRIYLEGMDVDQDYNKAKDYFEKAAESNNAQAYTFLAYMYANSLGVDKDDAKVVELYQKAYELGDLYASYALGFIYRKGLYGVDKDEAKALDYVEKASNGDIAAAKYEHAFLLDKQSKKLFKSADPQDKQKAEEMKNQSISLFRDSAKKDYAPAKYALAIKELDKDDENSAKEAFKLLDSAKDSDLPYVYYALAYLYDEGIGCKKDYFKSFEYFNKAFNAGYKKAAMNVAYAYLFGAGCAQNYKKALDMLREAVNGGIQEANYYAGLCFEYGLSVEKDMDKALELYGIAQQAGFAPAMLRIGQICDPYYGIGIDPTAVETEYKLAVDYGSFEAEAEMLKLAYRDDKSKFDEILKYADEGSKVAQEFVGTIYLDEQDEKHDEAKAIEYLKKSADAGFVPAAKKLVKYAKEKEDKVLEAKYEDMLTVFGVPKVYFERARALKEEGEVERSIFWYTMAGLTTKKPENVEKAENAIKESFKKNDDGSWSKVE